MKQQYYEPDAVDCNTMVTAIASDHGCTCAIETRYERDLVVVLVRCYKVGAGTEGLVQVQALVKAPLKSRTSLYKMQYSALLDCWHQIDRGLLAVAQTPMERDWNGRPKRPTPHDK